MIKESLLGLVHNASLLLALVLVFDLIVPNWKIGQTWKQKGLTGLVLGGIGIAIMLSPWIFIPGVVFDTRSILLGISGLFFGSVPTIIAMLMTAALRAYQGGTRAVMGISVILATGSIGILWRRIRKQPIHEISWKELYGFGVVIHIVMLALAFTMPLENAMQVINSVSLPVMLIYPVETALLGALFTARVRRVMITQKIQENETRYKIVAENTYDWEYWYGTDGKFIYCSPSCKEISGYSPEDLINNPDLTWKMVHPDDREIYKNHRETPAEEKKGRVIFFRIIRPDGTVRWIGHVCRPVYSSEGILLGTRGSNRDVTEQKLAAAKLQDSEEKYRVLTESIADVIWILDPETMKFQYVSPSVVKLRGYSVEEIMTETVDAALSPDKREGQKMLIRSRVEAFLNGTMPNDMVYFDEVEQPRKDGSTVWTEVSTSYYLNRETNRVEIRGVSRDISDQRQAKLKEAAAQKELQNTLAKLKDQLEENDKSRRAVLSMLEDLQQEQSLMRTLMDTIPDTIYFKDREGKFIRVNQAQAKRLGIVNLNDIIGKTDFDFFSTELAISAWNDEQYILQTGQSLVNVEEMLYFPDRPTEWVSTTKMPLHNQNGEIIGLYGVSRDITKQKQTEEELQSAYDATLEGWAEALKLREKETAKHSRNVVDMTLIMAKKLGISEEEMVHIRRGALLHDIGKMGIPDRILLKPEKLTEEEWVIMKRHPEFAFTLLSEIPYLKPALDIPYSHHERWNGSGYPQGLKGKNIPLTARIFAVVDVWDALSTDRPYRPAWKKDDVLKYLQEQAGIQFDPDIVAVFLETINQQNSVAIGSKTA